MALRRTFKVSGLLPMMWLLLVTTCNPGLVASASPPAYTGSGGHRQSRRFTRRQTLRGREHRGGQLSVCVCGLRRHRELQRRAERLDPGMRGQGRGQHRGLRASQQHDRASQQFLGHWRHSLAASMPSRSAQSPIPQASTAASVMRPATARPRSPPARRVSDHPARMTLPRPGPRSAARPVRCCSAGRAISPYGPPARAPPRATITPACRWR